MTIQHRWAVAVLGMSSAMLLTYSLIASGAAGGRPGGNRGGGGGHGGGQSVGARRPSAPAGMSAARPMGGRQPNFNSMAGARPTNNAMPRAGMTGMQSAAMRQNNPASRPDLGLRGGGNAQNFAQMRQPSTAI